MSNLITLKTTTKTLGILRRALALAAEHDPEQAEDYGFVNRIVESKHPHLHCEFADDIDPSDPHEHRLRKWDVAFTVPGVYVESGRFLREHRTVVEAGCSYAAEEALFDYAEERYGYPEAHMTELHER